MRVQMVNHWKLNHSLLSQKEGLKDKNCNKNKKNVLENVKGKYKKLCL